MLGGVARSRTQNLTGQGALPARYQTAMEPVETRCLTYDDHLASRESEIVRVPPPT